MATLKTSPPTEDPAGPNGPTTKPSFSAIVTNTWPKVQPTNDRVQVVAIHCVWGMAQQASAMGAVGIKIHSIPMRYAILNPSFRPNQNKATRRMLADRESTSDSRKPDGSGAPPIASHSRLFRSIANWTHRH